MAISWGTIKSLLIFFGPILLPKVISYYRTVRNAAQLHGLSVRPLPPRTQRALAVLFAVALVLLVKTLPPFAPENVFRITRSRLQIPTDVLFTRLAAIRPQGALTARDEVLRAKFVNLESRLLYLQFGPDVLADCPFCSSDEPRSYFYYVLPALLLPHLANLAVIAAVTSSVLTGCDGGATGWRTTATIAAAAVLFADVYFVNQYNYQANSRALRLDDLDLFFWTARVYRLVVLAALDGLLGWLVWLSGTNRAFATPPSAAERIEGVTRALVGARSRVNAVGIVKNAAVRDEELRGRSAAYWAHEVALMREVMEEREVIEGVNEALENRVDIRTISRDAEAYAQSVLQAPVPSAPS